MEINLLRCPACGATIPHGIKPNEQFRCPSCGSVLVLTDAEAANQVLCTRCQTINEATNRFCVNCGSTLQANCPFCYAANETDAVYCVSCGANIKKAFAQKAEWLAQKKAYDQDRRAALQQAEQARRRADLEQLLEKLDEPAQHPFAIYCLHEYGTDAVEPLIALLQDDDPDARFGAAHTLGLIGDERAIPGLINALADKEPAVRYWAAEALGKMHATSAAGALQKLLKDRHAGVRQHAALVLRQLTGERA
ncbi:MAG: HEAT repeat domain-containing protein [Chloroflexi bacterium]|nr:HEAT repeat domain-containing protein [Chloroflexota bacterium]